MHKNVIFYTKMLFFAEKCIENVIFRTKKNKYFLKK